MVQLFYCIFKSLAQLIFVFNELLICRLLPALIEKHESTAEQDEQKHPSNDEQVCARVTAQCGLVDPSEEGIRD